MVRTKDSSSRRAVGAKAPRKQVGGSSSGSSSASSSSSSCKSPGRVLGGGGNLMRVCDVPAWQKGIMEFYRPKASNKSPSSSKSKASDKDEEVVCISSTSSSASASPALNGEEPVLINSQQSDSCMPASTDIIPKTSDNLTNNKSKASDKDEEVACIPSSSTSASASPALDGEEPVLVNSQQSDSCMPASPGIIPKTSDNLTNSKSKASDEDGEVECIPSNSSSAFASPALDGEEPALINSQQSDSCMPASSGIIPKTSDSLTSSKSKASDEDEREAVCSSLTSISSVSPVCDDEETVLMDTQPDSCTPASSEDQREEDMQ